MGLAGLAGLSYWRLLQVLERGGFVKIRSAKTIVVHVRVAPISVHLSGRPTTFRRPHNAKSPRACVPWRLRGIVAVTRLGWPSRASSSSASPRPGLWGRLAPPPPWRVGTGQSGGGRAKTWVILRASSATVWTHLPLALPSRPPLQAPTPGSAQRRGLAGGRWHAAQQQRGLVPGDALPTLTAISLTAAARGWRRTLGAPPPSLIGRRGSLPRPGRVGSSEKSCRLTRACFKRLQALCFTTVVTRGSSASSALERGGFH
jgi:hypothetical protein